MFKSDELNDLTISDEIFDLAQKVQTYARDNFGSHVITEKQMEQLDSDLKMSEISEPNELEQIFVGHVIVEAERPNEKLSPIEKLLYNMCSKLPSTQEEKQKFIETFKLPAEISMRDSEMMDEIFELKLNQRESNSKLSFAKKYGKLAF